MKLQIGSRTKADGWKTLDIVPGPDVDYVGDCRNLAVFPDNALDAIYASHVLEHVPYRETETVLREWLRALKAGGEVMISVPDFEMLCRLFLHPQAMSNDRVFVMQMAFGGQVDAHDFHFVGFSSEILDGMLTRVGFADRKRVEKFGLFEDTSTLAFHGIPISLNMTARKPG